VRRVYPDSSMQLGGVWRQLPGTAEQGHAVELEYSGRSCFRLSLRPTCWHARRWCTLSWYQDLSGKASENKGSPGTTVRLTSSTSHHSGSSI
jgi:hypothetical protein